MKDKRMVEGKSMVDIISFVVICPSKDLGFHTLMWLFLLPNICAHHIVKVSFLCCNTGRWYGCPCCKTGLQICQGACPEEWTNRE